MSDDEKKLLTDVFNAVEGIAVHIQGIKSFNDFKAAYTVKRAVERELLIIGEAIGDLRKLNPAIAISDMRKIIALRNIIAHEYDSVQDDNIWLIIVRHLPGLKDEVDKLIKS
ncbi:MAG: DUF86 domain-containing protein [Chitinophagaceae bacterium]|nr:DUF86 domain-containing protein [Chitinophagaceae bacterium]